GPFVHGQEELPLARPAPEDAQVAMEDRRAGGAPDVPELAQVVTPLLVASEIVAVQPGGAVADVDALAVGDGAGRAVGIRIVGRLGLLVLDFLLPQQVAVLAGEAHDCAAVALVVERLRQGDAIAPDDGRGVAGAGELDLPADVVGLAPGE